MFDVILEKFNKYFRSQQLVNTSPVDQRKYTVYENLWNDGVKPNVLLIFKVDNKLILYLKSNVSICGKLWFKALVNHTLPQLEPLDFKYSVNLLLTFKISYIISLIFVYCTFSIIFFDQRALTKCWLIVDYENICWIFLLLYHKSLK